MEKRFDSELSASIARRVRAQFRRCWRNAALAVGQLGDDGYYVEGWVVTGRTDPYVIEHGWCEVDARIVDPSFTPYAGSLEPPVAYFAGTRFDPAQTAAALGHRRLPMSWAHDDEEYRCAFEAAWRDAASRRRFSEPPQPTRIVHCRRDPFEVFIGRPSKWANPFHIGPDGTREQVIAKFHHWLIRQPQLLHDVWSLRGKVLGCKCLPLPCHGEVLARLADLSHVNGSARAATHAEGLLLP